MTINQLLHFLEIAKCGNFTKAAANLYISQPAISKSVQLLEKDLDTQLIDRSSKKFALTTEGKILFERGQIAMEIINNQISYLYDCVQSRKGRVIIGVPPVMGTAAFTRVFREFKDVYPEIELKFVEEGANNVLSKVLSGEIDVGAVMLPVETEDVHIIPYMKSENVLLVHKDHRFANRESVSFSELRNERFISLDGTYMLPNRMKYICLNAGFKPNIILESTQWDFIAEMVSLNQGVAILPKPIMGRFASKEVRTIRLTDPSFPWEVALAVKSDKLISGSLKVFIEYIRSKCKYSRANGNVNTDNSDNIK